ncbi:hypothetical protein V8F06_014431 [Rhypophila decipiens]
MGLTGSGKSTFISRLTGQHEPQETGIGHGLASKTIDITCYTAQYDQTRIIRLIDTPGFDDTTRSDTEVLNSIASHLDTLHRARQHLLGIICLHRITDVRLSGSAIRNFTILKKLCGPENYHKIVLATTMWGDVAALDKSEQKQAALLREERLFKYWHDLFQGRSPMVPYVDDEESQEKSARRTVGFLINNRQRNTATNVYYQPLQIQHEMVDRAIPLENTEAGRYVRGEILSANRTRLDREIAELEEAVNKARREADVALRRTGVKPGPGPSSTTRQLAARQQQQQQGEEGEQLDTWMQNILPSTSSIGRSTGMIRDFFGSMFNVGNSNGGSGENLDGNNKQNAAPLTSSSTSDLGY